MKQYKKESITSTFQLLLNEIASYPLLSFDEENELLNAIMLGRDAKACIDQITDENSISTKEYHDLIALAEKGDAAKERLVNCNMRLVVSEAMNYKASGLPIMDIIQEGSMGLAHAIDKFEPNYGNKLSTYATYWIRQNITRAIDNQKRMIRIPTHMLQEINRFNKTISELKASGFSNPTNEQIAEKMNISVKRVRNLYEWDKDSVSLDMVINDDDNSSLEKMIASDSESPSEKMINSCMHEAISSLLNNLPERERDVIMLRYGFLDGKEYTLEEIGEKLNVTRERIRQIESRAIKLMRNSSEIEAIKAFAR